MVGGGDSAAEEASFLTRYASKVFLLVRRDQMRASKVMQERVMKNPKIEILWNTLPVAAEGDGRLLNALKLKDTKTNEERKLPVNGFFYAIGHQPNTEWVKAEGKSPITLDSDGYVVHVNKGTTETNIPGVFAAGDVADKRYRQAISAAGSGWYLQVKSVEFLHFL